MRKFLRNLLLALIPVAVINALCWGTLVFLAWQDDLTYVNWIKKSVWKNWEISPAC